jgi:cytosine permease
MSNLPSYLAAAKPVPLASRAPWYKTIMPTYLGIMLWFVFWQDLVKGNVSPSGVSSPGGVLSEGLFPAFCGLVIAGLICHFLFYMAPALLGMRTGLPLYVVGTSTYGARGGLFMPGFLMGLLQFGWLAVNSWAVASILCVSFNIGVKENATGAYETVVPGWPHGIIAAAFAVVAAFVGLKGIKYVARIATFLPIIPIVLLLALVVMTWGGMDHFNQNLKTFKEYKPTQADYAKFELAPNSDPDAWAEANPWVKPLTNSGIIEVLCIYIVGFFATAGAAGADIASNARSVEDVHIGGITGVFLPTIIAGSVTLWIVGSAFGAGMIQAGNLNPVAALPDIFGHVFGKAWGPNAVQITMVALAISSFPAACFSALIAANSFKTTMPKIDPFITVGIGTLVAVVLAVSGVVGTVIWVFEVIGASFGPVCGAMLADYLLSGGKWSGPRAGFNPAGWISWIVGFAVGAFNLVINFLLKTDYAATSLPHLIDYWHYVPMPPVTAFVVGFALYLVLSVLGLRTRKLDMPALAA